MSGRLLQTETETAQHTYTAHSFALSRDPWYMKGIRVSSVMATVRPWPALLFRPPVARDAGLRATSFCALFFTFPFSRCWEGTRWEPLLLPLRSGSVGFYQNLLRFFFITFWSVYFFHCQEWSSWLSGANKVDGIPGCKWAKGRSGSRFAAAALPWLNPYLSNSISAQ